VGGSGCGCSGCGTVAGSGCGTVAGSGCGTVAGSGCGTVAVAQWLWLGVAMAVVFKWGESEWY
jgi:hypothetical protein